MDHSLHIARPAVQEGRKCGGDGRGTASNKVWNVHGGPWCSFECILNWWGPTLAGNTGFSSTSSRLKSTFELTADESSPSQSSFRPAYPGNLNPRGPFHHFRICSSPAPRTTTITSPEDAEATFGLLADMKRPNAYQLQLHGAPQTFWVPIRCAKDTPGAGESGGFCPRPNGPVPKCLPSSS